ncbi:UNVERIFIED_CONTAM: hypothetical protein GTU68_032881 [Idotea baltica]|nr:hypothetical protein [Idotea baltica]
MILECGKKYIPDNTTYLNYAFCVMGADYPPSSGASCAAEVGVSFEPIEQCSNSTEGELILHEVGVAQSQLDPSVFYVPWIIVNDVSMLLF